MMSLEEAIEHAEGVADEKLKNAEFIKNNPYGDKSKIQGCVECAAEHRQLAEWLRELQERRKEPEIVFCKDCRKHNVRVGYEVSFKTNWRDDACPLADWRGKAQGHEFDYQYCVYAERRTE